MVAARRFLAFASKPSVGLEFLGVKLIHGRPSAWNWSHRNHPQDIQSVDLPDALHQRCHGLRVRLHEALEVGRILCLERRS